ncbi:MAG: invasin domain 3-containing protein, partial [Deferrisomatales bacterium]
EAFGGTGSTGSITVNPAAPSRVTVAPNPSQIPPDGITESTVSIQAQDEFGNPVGGSVAVTAPGGNLSAGTLDLINGQGAVRLTAAAPGEIPVTATLGALSGTADLVVVQVLAGQPASLSVAVEPETLSVAGVGGADVATIRVTVRDNGGNPIQDTGVFNNLKLEIVDAPGGGENLQGKTIAAGPVTLSTQNGLASANFQSGLLPGTVRLRVSVVKDRDGIVLAVPLTALVPQITIQAGPPFDAVLSRSNAITDNHDGTLTHEHLAVVKDRYGNKVPDGTAVFFGQVFNFIAAGNDGATAAGSPVFTSAGANFLSVPGPAAGDTLIVYDDASVNKGGYLLSSVAANSLTTLTTFGFTESSLLYVVGNSRGGGALSAGTQGLTSGGVARWANTYPGELVNQPIFAYTETSGRRVGDARPFRLSWVLPTRISLLGLPAKVAAGTYAFDLGLRATDSSTPSTYRIPDLPFQLSVTSGTLSAVTPPFITTPRVPQNGDAGGNASFVWTVTLAPLQKATLTVTAGETTATFVVEGE